MQLIVPFGRPAVGKLTVARELAALSGWRLFHNHLVVDALLAVFDFASPPFVALREKIWRDVFAAASHTGPPALLFTFNPEHTVSQAFVDTLVADAAARGDRLRFIELTCPEAEIERRLDAGSRRDTGKLTSLALYRGLARSGAFDRPVIPPPEFSVDTFRYSAADAARLIWTHLRGAP